jgi:hypothetical protein
MSPELPQIRQYDMKHARPESMTACFFRAVQP